MSDYGVNGLIDFLEGVIEYGENPRKWDRLAQETRERKEMERPGATGNVALPPKRVRNGNR